MKDAYGVEIEEGDIVLSIANSGNIKFGKVVLGRKGNLLVEHHTDIGWYYSKRKWNKETKEFDHRPDPIRTQISTTNIVIRKANGWLTDTMEGILDLD
jgi:intein-encoded DNA endonuclease-like protein